MMSGVDLLGGFTWTPPVSSRSESGQGIMGVKPGKGMLLCMLYSGGLVVVDVVGDWSLTSHRVNVSMSMCQCQCQCINVNVNVSMST